MLRFWSRRIKPAKISFHNYRNAPIVIERGHARIGRHRFSFSDILDCGDTIGVVPIQQIVHVAETFIQLTHGECHPQMAALVFTTTNNPRAFDGYFPIINILAPAEITSFYQLAEKITRLSEFDLQLIGEQRTNVTAQMPSSVSRLVAGHLAEVFFYRQDILECFLARPRHIRLYTTRRAFAGDGGQAGGDYDPRRECLQLVLSRLFEGFYDDTPGVAPFLHELGHMLDQFDANTGTMGVSNGLLPGLSPDDGAIFTPRARELFVKGKRLELERYLDQYRRQTRRNDPLPIGHPYVFQNDTEFAAGYFEMFFRNPHYFAQQNPDLHNAYVELFRYDPCHAWKQDFPFYVRENQRFYLFSLERPREPHITIPDA